MALAQMTQLDAINKMLESVWELPISTLIGSASGAVAMAKRILDETTMSIQSRGWAFNTEENILLTPDVTGTIYLPANALEVNPMGVDKLVQGVMRDKRLYDRQNHTFNFLKAVNVRLISFLQFEDLPQCARFYIACAATRVFKDQFQDKEGPSAPLQVEMEALRDLEEHEGQTDHANMFTDSWSVGNILDR